jgi:hypothetical protein
LIKVYATLVLKGEITIEDVPEKLRQDVEDYLNELV